MKIEGGKERAETSKEDTLVVEAATLYVELIEFYAF